MLESFVLSEIARQMTWSDELVELFTTATGINSKLMHVGVQTLTVAGTGRYVRMNGTARATQYGYSLWEFQIYGGTPASAARDGVSYTVTVTANDTTGASGSATFIWTT